MKFRGIVDDPTEIEQPLTADASFRRTVGATTWIRFAKLIVAIVVIAGLFLAGRSSIAKWKVESAKIETEIGHLDEALSIEVDPNVRLELRNRLRALRESVPSFKNVDWRLIASAAIVYGLGLLPSALLLRRAVVSLGGRPRLVTVVVAQLLGHVGKYVPGKAMVVILRGGVLSRDGVRPMTSTISVFLETFLMMAVGAVVAAVATVGLPVPTWITVLSIATALLAGIPTLPPLLRRIATRANNRTNPELQVDPGWSLFFAGWGWSLLSWLLIGAAFTMLIVAMPASQPHPPWLQIYPIATAAISLAMVVGFASLLPGGAGVRELVLVAVLGIAIDSAHGLLAAIAARVTFMAVEACLAAMCWVWLALQPAGPSTPDQETPMP